MTGLPWKPVVYLPANLTVSLGEMLAKDDDPWPWCEAKAVALLGPGASGKQVSKLAYCLAEYVGHFRGDGPYITAALFFYPDFSQLPPRANATIEAFGGHPRKGPLTMSMMRELIERPDELSFGETGITETQVPAGPALRVHRYRKAQPAKRRSPIGEEVVWLISPRGSTVAVDISVRWLEPMFSEAGAKIADDMAQNFRIEPKETAAKP